MPITTTSKPEKIEPGSLAWMEEVHQRLLDGHSERALTMVEAAMARLKNAGEEKAKKAEIAKTCPDCFGSGFRPTGPERNAPVRKCNHKGTQPILKAEPDIPF
jgi:hypothetical protein